MLSNYFFTAIHPTSQLYVWSLQVIQSTACRFYFNKHINKILQKSIILEVHRNQLLEKHSNHPHAIPSSPHTI